MSAPTVKDLPCAEAQIRAGQMANGGCAERAKPWVLAATILGSSLTFIDGSVVNVALPMMQQRLNASLGEMQWVVNAYMLLLAALILLGGAAGDRFGRRRVFVLGVAVFTVASMWCGLAPSVEQLIVARGLQGAGGALLVPASLAIISASFPERERGAAIGTWAGYSAITTALGPVLGGWLVDAVSWRAIFLINVPLALITVAIALWRVPADRPAATGGAAQRLDGIGSLLAALGLGALSYGLIAYAEAGPGWWPALLAGAALLIGFVITEARVANPMMPLGLFRSRTFSGVNMMTLLLYFALSGVFFFLPYNLIQVQHYSVLAAGAAFLPFTLVMGGLSRWSGGLLDRYGAQKPLLFGPLIVAAGLLLLALPGAGGSYWATFFPGIGILGLGMAVSVAPLSATVMSAVADRHAGAASGINNAVSRVSTLLAVAVLGVLAQLWFQAGLAQQLDTAVPELAVTARQALLANSNQLAALPLPQALDEPLRQHVTAAIDAAFVASFRGLMLLLALLALLSALCAWLTVDASRDRAGPHASREK